MAEITILDGGLGQELIKRSGKATGLWSTQALLDAPEMVRAVHDDYFAAGAHVVTTDTYAILPDRMEPEGLLDQMYHLSDTACEIAVAARDANGSGIVAGSLGPQGFSYQPDKCPPAKDAAAAYGPLAKRQAQYVDVHILETMASVDQVLGGLMGCADTGKPVWLSLTVDDSDGTKLRSGERIEDVFSLIEEYKPAVVNINCSLPEVVSVGLPVLAQAGVPFGAYANGFTGIHADFNKVGATVDILKARTDLGPAEYLAYAKDWVAMGATHIGGCCEVGPAHIRALADHFGA
ncbi:MAG: homocysteine S-methyltransferase family protein [Pseudomonadota bacterium]